MTFKTELSKKTGIKEELLPAGYQRIGDIIILNMKPGLDEEKIAQAVHELQPTAKTIMIKETGITGEYREPHLRKIWGNGTETIHNEHDCKFKIDVTKVMWAKGNMNERKRIYTVARDGENVLDMFCGLGYFSIPLAKHHPTSKIIAIEKNPEAVKLLKENIELNKLTNITVIQADSKIEAPKHEKWAERIIMGYIPEPREFLPMAFTALKDKGTIHYEGIRNAGEEETLYEPVQEEGERNGYKCELIHTQNVKSYGPKRWHVVVDVECEKIKQ